MKVLRRIVSVTLALVLALAAFPWRGARADRMYLIADSDKRLLTYEELWTWDYESLGYILNEIFARHGYVFEPGGKYDYYFSCMPWYQPNSSSDNQRYCYPQLNSKEWANQQLVKDVRAEMRALGTRNPSGKSVWSGFSPSFTGKLQGFSFIELKAGQKLAVYSAPARGAYRGANGKAMISTNGAVYAAGWESGWLLVMYETNTGVRVGYVASSEISGSVPEYRQLSFEYAMASVGNTVRLTDDPVSQSSTITTLGAGSAVTYLTTFVNNRAWDYVETSVNGKVTRGFIPSGNLDITASVDEDSMFDDAQQ